MSRYRLSVQAEKDIIRIYNYGAKRFGSIQAEKYFDNLFAHFEIIAQNPKAFESVDYIRKGYRKCPCGTDCIFYRVLDESIEIMTIVGRQEIDAML